MAVDIAFGSRISIFKELLEFSFFQFKTNEIFRASDLMVDSLTNLLDRERKKRKAN